MVIQLLTTGLLGGKPESFPDSQQAQVMFSMDKGKGAKSHFPYVAHI